MNIKYLFLLPFLALIEFSCSRVLSPLTQDLIDENKWTEKELTKIQFYLSDQIVLRRKATSGATEIQGGKIKTINGEKIEEIVFEQGTPGVLEFLPKENRFAISFEQGDKPKYLMFGPNPKMGDKYVLLGKEWERNGGQVTYNNEIYYTPSQSAFTCLLIDLKRAKNIERKTIIVKGRKVE